MTTPYSQFDLNANQQIGMANKQTQQKLLRFAEDSIKWLVNFISQMVRMFLGK